jgi:hypothetical protein
MQAECFWTALNSPLWAIFSPFLTATLGVLNLAGVIQTLDVWKES